MKKIRWLYAEWPLSITNISKKLLLNQYSEQKGEGFLLSSSGKKMIVGRYIEKSKEKSIITDPFGNEIESFITSYYVSKFSIFNTVGLLQLNDPPRSLRKLLSELHNIFGLGLVLSDFNVDLLLWLENIEKLLVPVIVTNISASGIRIPQNGLAKIAVAGKKDIRNEFYKLIGKKSYRIDSLKLVMNIKECNISVELLKSGAIRFSGHIYDGFIEDMRSCLEISK